MAEGKKITTTNNRPKAKRKTKELAYYECPRCGATKNEEYYYKTKSSMIWDKTDGRVTFACKDCVDGLFRVVNERHGERWALAIACHWLDMPYVDSIYQGVLQRNGGFDLGTYVRTLSSSTHSTKNFISSMITDSFREDTAERVAESIEARWGHEDLRTKREVIEMLGGDPFEGYDAQDRRYLFTEIAKYLDEDVLEDAYKLSQIIQIVTNNLQIRRCDLQIAQCDIVKNADTIKTLNTIKKDLVSSNDKIAKENEISVRNRTNKEAGKGTLTFLMRDLREKDLKEAQSNYYDQLYSDGSRWAVEMSMRALAQNTMFDENDKQEIFIGQRELILSLQEQLADKTEECRLLKVENKELKESG